MFWRESNNHEAEAGRKKMVYNRDLINTEQIQRCKGKVLQERVARKLILRKKEKIYKRE